MVTRWPSKPELGVRFPSGAVQPGDYFTWTRLILYIPISIAAFFGAIWWVFWLYIFAQLTDVLDGFVARQTGTASERGAKLDSRIDTIGLVFYLYWLWELFPTVFSTYLWWIIALGVGIIAVLGLSYWRRKEITGLHLYTGKAAAIAGAILLPALIVFGSYQFLIQTVFVIGYLSIAEEAAFFILDKKNLDAKTVFDA